MVNNMFLLHLLEALEAAYEEWFASGIISAKVTPIHTGWFDEGYLYMTAESLAFDKDGSVVKEHT